MGRLSLLVLLSVLAPPTAASATLLQNGRFIAIADGLPVGWRVEAWARDLSDVAWEPWPGGSRDGAGMVRIVNRSANDARLCQSIAVTAGASYRISAQVRTENVGLTTAGALIAIEPRVADSVDVKGTQDWRPLEVTATNADQSRWDVCLRLGSYANLNTGTAWFSDVKAEIIGGSVPPAGGSRWPSLGFAPVLSAFRQTGWLQTALPIVAGIFLAFGLGIFGRRPS
jgi:hypothetical protein